MHTPELNPATALHLNGKRRRYANGTVATRHVRLSREADRDLADLQRVLSSDNPSDVATVSLVVRRALAIFRRHVAALQAEGLDMERRAVRQGSLLPHLRKKSCQPQPPSNASKNAC